MLPKYDIDISGSKRLVTLRIINADRSGYIFPDIILHDYDINLEVLQSVLQDLVEQGHIQILQTPNRKLTDEERARKDDEEDYYFIKINESFSNYYRQIEQTADFHNADREHVHITNEVKDTVKPSKSSAVLPPVEKQLEGGFNIHEGGIISYKGQEINLEKRLAVLAGVIMKRSEKGLYTNKEYIANEVIDDDKDYEAPQDYAVKLVSKLRKDFQKQLGTKHDYFKSKSGYGYKFSPVNTHENITK